jgi:hypothetical protein
MRSGKHRYLVCLVILTLVTVPALSALGDIPALDLDGPTDVRTGSVIDEMADETHNWRDARELVDGDIYNGHVDRVDDESDHFTVTAAQYQEINVHVYLMGHDGIDEWSRPPTTTPPSPPSPPRTSAMLECYIYHDPATDYPLDGAFNYYYVRHYVLNVVAPMPGTHTYHVNVSLDWAWTPNNYTWDYKLELEIGAVPEISEGEVVNGQLDMAGRDTRWYKVWADAGTELNGSFEILNFDDGDPESRNVDIWVFPDDLGGYPRSVSWDWSAAPNEPVEPFSILATYGGFYFIKLRGMNHESILPCSYALYTETREVPAFPDTGIQSAYFDRHWHDTDWYRFDMLAEHEHPTKPGQWNDVQYFNMTERADGEELPDFDLYLFGLAPDSRNLDLLDSSFRNDHATFLDVDRDPNRNTEHVSAAAFYSGTYYLEVNAFNNTGYYDVRREFKSPILSDEDNLPGNARDIGPGKYEGYIHQSKDHYDWYSVEVDSQMTIRFDTFKVTDMFNLSIYKYDSTMEEYRLLRSDWNVHFNLTSRQDEVTNDINVDLDLRDLGLGKGTYLISVFAAVATGIGTDPVSGRPFVYVTDGEAEAHYELWAKIDGILDHKILTVPIDTDTVEEDTDLLKHLDLDDHFIPSDPTFELDFKARLISGKGRVILDVDSLGFQAAPDFVGRVVVRVTATTTNYIQAWLEWTIDFTSVNDAPRTSVAQLPLVYTMPEDSIRMLDLGSKVYDVDAGDTITVDYDAPEHMSIDMDDETMDLTLLGHPDWFGQETVEFTFTDTNGAQLVLPVMFVVENVADGPVLLQVIDDIHIIEDTSTTVSLYEYISDPDGDPLTVHVSEDPFVGYQWDAETGMLTLAPAADWFGGRLLWVTATDPSGRQLQTSIWLDVEGVSDPPVFQSVSPSAFQVTILEGSEQTFAVLEVLDDDSSILFYKWFVDGVFIGPSISFNYKPGIQDQGAHEITVIVEDEDGLHDTRVWTVDVEDVPHLPDGGIATPPDGAKFRENDPVPFVAFYYDPDGDDLTYTWYIDGKLASDEQVFEQRLDAGDHKVTLQVTSDGDSVTEELDVTVLAEDVGVPTGAVLALAFVIIITVVAIALFVRRRGG